MNAKINSIYIMKPSLCLKQYFIDRYVYQYDDFDFYCKYEIVPYKNKNLCVQNSTAKE